MNTILSPENSPLFRKFIHPESHVASYLLAEHPFVHNQSIYFTTKSMTNDGRFIILTASEAEGTGSHPKAFYLIDMLKGQLIDMKLSCGLPFVDADNDYMIYLTNDGFFKRDFLADPTADIKICGLPKEINALGSKIYYLYTHLTLSPDKSYAFLDLRADDHFYQGLVNLKDETWELWGETPFFANHGQLNPVNPRLAMCAWELEYNDSKGKRHVIEHVDGHYPRMWLIEPNGKHTMIPALDANYATHELWCADGKGLIWCSERAPGGGSKYAFQLATGQEPTTDWKEGVYYHELETGKQSCICPFPAIHATVSKNMEYVTHDYPVGRWWRGCAWQVGFYNRNTGKHVYIYPEMAQFTPEDKPSTLHPDPHPTFVCNDKYIICTTNDGKGAMEFSITPVDQLIDMTR